jgi:hypothetical protein
MSTTLAIVQELVKKERVRISDHGNDEILEDEMDLEALLDGVRSAVLVEDYPDAFKGPSVLVLQDLLGKPVHVVWGLSKLNPEIATLITAYFPNPAKWYDGYMKRKPA